MRLKNNIEVTEFFYWNVTRRPDITISAGLRNPSCIIFCFKRAKKIWVQPNEQINWLYTHNMRVTQKIPFT